MFRKILIVICLATSGLAFTQVKEFDQLEMLFSQQHYKLVLLKANRLLDKPDYDYSYIPKMYRSFALFQLSQNERWYRRNNSALSQAAEILKSIQSSSVGEKTLEAHQFELAALKNDLYLWGEDLVRMGKEEQSKEVKLILAQLFEGVSNIEQYAETTRKPKRNLNVSGSRSEVLTNAEAQLGVPYKWAGRDKNGFDCSGFTSFVYSQNNIVLPRRAADQYKEAEQIKEKNAEPGDLIFFSNGSGISHVGIIYSIENEEISMIHSSSSQGIVITNVTNSVYWQKRIAGCGRYLN